jgi:hypothetical protein
MSKHHSKRERYLRADPKPLADIFDRKSPLRNLLDRLITRKFYFPIPLT